MEHNNSRLLVMVTSEGGPPIVHDVLSQLRSDFPIPIVVSQVFRSGAIDPVSKALDKTTQLVVESVTGSINLLPGHAYVMHRNLDAVVEHHSGSGSPKIEVQGMAGVSGNRFARFLRSASIACQECLMVAMAGGITDTAVSLRGGLNAVCRRGGRICLVGDPESAMPASDDHSIVTDLGMDAVTVDELVVKLYEWWGITSKIRHRI